MWTIPENRDKVCLSNRNETMSYFDYCVILRFIKPCAAALRLNASRFNNFSTILSPLCAFQKGLRCVAPIVW